MSIGHRVVVTLSLSILALALWQAACSVGLAPESGEPASRTVAAAESTSGALEATYELRNGD